MNLRRGLLFALLLSLLSLLSLVAGCAGSSSTQTIDPAPAKRSLVSPSPSTSPSAIASTSPSAPSTEPPALACPDPAPPIPPGKDRASLVLQDGHTTMIIQVELSANGRLLASTGLDGTIRIWDTKTGIQLRRIPTQGASLSTSLSSSGATLAFLRTDTGDQPTVATVALSAGADAKSLNQFGRFQLSQDGKMLALGYRDLDIVVPETGAKLQSISPFKTPAKAPAGAKLDPAYDYNTICAVAFDETASRLAVTTGLELAIIDTSTWKVILKRPHGMGVPAGSPGGPPKGLGPPPPPAMPGADPKIIHPGWFATSLILRGDTLVIVSSLGVRMVSARDGGSPRALPTPLLSATVLGDKLLTTDYMSRVAAWSLATGAPASVPGLERLKGMRVSASADGSTIALASQAGSTSLARSGLMDLRIYDARSLRLLRTIEPHLAVVEGVAVRPDGRQLAVASRDGSLGLWSLVTGELLSLNKGAMGLIRWRLVYDDSGEVIAVMSQARHIRLHDAKSGRLLRQWEPTGQTLMSAWFLPGKKELATLDSAGSIKVWDVAPPVPPQPPRDIGVAVVAKPQARDGGSIPGPIESAAVSADRTRVAAISADRTVVVPDPTGRLKFKDVYSESNVVLADVTTSAGVTRASVRWTSKVISGYTAKWLAFAPDDQSVLFSSMEDSRGMLTSKPPNVFVPGGLLRVFDGATGALSRSQKMAAIGPMAAASKAIALGGRFPVVLAWPSLAARSVAAPDYMVNTVAANPQRGSFIFGGDSGGATLASGAGDVSTILASSGGGEYVTATLDGVFRSSLDGARSVAWTFGVPLEGFSFEQFAARFARPDIIAERLAGGVVPSPAAVIRPPIVSLDRSSAAGASGATSASGATGASGATSVPILTRSARVRARVESPRRVDRVRVFVNGRPAADELVCAPKGEIDVEVPVLLGRNRLTVVAYDADGYASNPETLDVTSAAASSSRPDLWVIAVGVSKYKNLGPEHQLNFADDDARSVAGALAGEVGPGRPFGALKATTLIDEEVTVESVERSLGTLAGMGPDDLAVVFLAGHGVSLEGGKMVYLTSAASLSKEAARSHGVGWDAIRAALGRARGRVVVLLDACHSGHVSTDLIAPNEALAKELSSEGRSGVLVFAAARGSQLSYEVSPGQASLGSTRGLELAWEGKPAAVSSPPPGGHGLFTSAVLEALSGKAPDADRSGAVEVGEFIDYVTERVREASNGQQTPWVARREMFGDFIVAPASP